MSPSLGTPPATDIRLADLAFTHSVVAHLKDVGIYFLADLSEITLRELATVPGVGAHTLERIRAALARHGMCLKDDPDPLARARDRNQASLAAGPRQPQPGTPLEEIGVSPALFVRCWMAGLRTAAQVSKLTAGEVYRRFGEGQGEELLGIVEMAGLRVEHDLPLCLEKGVPEALR